MQSVRPGPTVGRDLDGQQTDDDAKDIRASILPLFASRYKVAAGGYCVINVHMFSRYNINSERNHKDSHTNMDYGRLHRQLSSR